MMSSKSEAEQKSAPDGAETAGEPNKSLDLEAPKPAVRQRVRQTNGGIKQQDLPDAQSPTAASKRRSSSREELEKELQAELGRKLSLARSRLEQSEQLERRANESRNDHQRRKLPDAPIDLALSLSLPVEKSPLKTPTGCSPRPYPKKVLFIIANEFCERFSYYGLRTVLVMYLTQVLNFSDPNSTITFHLFTVLCTVTPVLGAILGDSILGKFKTIFYLSMVYMVGDFILMLSSLFWNYGHLSMWSTFVGLMLIGFGTGGIKPCVSALGGDQFLDHEDKWRQSFFSLFYAAINLGSLISVFVTPLLRTEFQCAGRQDCYPYAFGLPCALMFLSVVVFLMAKNQYYLAPLPQENVIVSFCRCIWIAFKRKLSNQEPNFVLGDDLAIVGKQDSTSCSSDNVSDDAAPSSAQSSNTHLAPAQVAPSGKAQEVSRGRSHWLYLAADHFDSKSIEAFRSVLSLLLLFIPTIVYWCLYDQQGSLWTLQATRMDGHIFGAGRYVLQPDQMGIANPLILLSMIPIFEMLIYPALGRCNLLKKPLQRITVGGFVASLAFLSSALVELRIQQFLPPSEPQLGSANLILVNGLRECSIANPTISYIPMPDVVHEMVSMTNPILMPPSSNQTDTDGEQQTIGQQAYNRQVSIGLDTLEALAVRSINVQSDKGSALRLSNYQLRFKLNDSMEQISSNMSFGCPIASLDEHEFSLAPFPDQTTRLVYLELGNGRLTYKVFNESLELPPSNKARVRLLYEFFGSSSQAEKRQFYLISGKQSASRKNESHTPDKDPKRTFSNYQRGGQVLLSSHVDIEVPTSGATFSLESSDTKLVWRSGAATDAPTSGRSIFLEPGTRNLLIVHQGDANNVWLKHQLLQDNKYRINMLYQLIPYTLISVSEVMFSITGLEFSYSMAPDSMKSVLLAIWSLTMAFGNLLTVFVESLQLFSNVAHEFMFYACLLALDMCIFAIMGHNFKPNKSDGHR